MSANKDSIKTNLNDLDAHVIQPDEYQDLPGFTEEILDHSVFKINAVEQPHPRRRGERATKMTHKNPKNDPL